MSKSKKTNAFKKIIKKKPNTATIVGASLAAVAAGAYYSYSKGSWPFGSKKAGQKKGSGGHTGNGKSAADNVDVALTNEVADSTMHNPNNAGDFVDEGATGNAD